MFAFSFFPQFTSLPVCKAGSMISWVEKYPNAFPSELIAVNSIKSPYVCSFLVKVMTGQDRQSAMTRITTESRWVQLLLVGRRAHFYWCNYSLLPFQKTDLSDLLQRLSAQRCMYEFVHLNPLIWFFFNSVAFVGVYKKMHGKQSKHANMMPRQWWTMSSDFVFLSPRPHPLAPSPSELSIAWGWFAWRFSEWNGCFGTTPAHYTGRLPHVFLARPSCAALPRSFSSGDSPCCNMAESDTIT